MKKLLMVSLAVAALMLAQEASAQQLERPSHLDHLKQSRGCAGCHRGSGKKGTPLLSANMERFCFECHGIDNRKWAKTDIESVLSKVSVHPIIDTGHLHQLGEILPEESSTVNRHVSCYDCHVVHFSSSERPWRGAKGYLPTSIRDFTGGGPPPGLKGLATDEFELCYLCHSDSANLPLTSRKISADFDPENPSFHPVETVGRNRNVPSLVYPLTVTSRVTCGDCHGNSDVTGPKGPHGSDYEPLLLAEYRKEDGAENTKVYELCYMCHDRQSIYADISFKRHYLHVVMYDTSCYTCHASHGSRTNEHLISFNDAVVTASTNSGGPTYFSSLAGTPKCFLNCHGIDHNNADVGGKKWPW